MQAWQLARIRALVTHAYEKVPFYRDLYGSASFEPGDLNGWDDFAALPVVTKDHVIESYPDRIVERGRDPARLIVSRSSGSSGKVLDIAYDHRALITFVMAGLRLYRMGFDYRPWHRQAYVYTSPYPLSSLFGLYPLHFIHTLTPVDEIIRQLKARRPHLLVCYPSHLQQIARSASPQDLEAIRPRLISVNSEMSTQAERAALAAQFGCPVLDEYSSEELTRIAAQCRHGTYHVFEDINLLEILDEQRRPVDGSGIIVGTNLHNFAMPMIRYEQNDLGRLEEADCPCGWRFRALRNLEGRRNDSFTLPSGTVLSSGFLLDATYEFLLVHGTAVRDFCLIQEAADRIVLQVVTGPQWSRDVAGRIETRFREFLEEGVSLQIDPVEACERTRTGKRNPIINRMNAGT
jgi:phenylacetate-CoA ligase